MLAELYSLVTCIALSIDLVISVSIKNATSYIVIVVAIREILVKQAGCPTAITSSWRSHETINQSFKLLIILEDVNILLTCQLCCTNMNVKTTSRIYSCTYSIQRLDSLLQSCHTICIAIQYRTYNLVRVNITTNWSITNNLEIALVIGVVIALRMNINTILTTCLYQGIALGMNTFNLNTECINESRWSRTARYINLQHIGDFFLTKTASLQCNNLFVARHLWLLDFVNSLN